jgi:hypothetical protein
MEAKPGRPRKNLFEMSRVMVSRAISDHCITEVPDWFITY